MAEFQETPVSQSQLAQRFIEFVMMQAQQTSIFLGKIPNPAHGKIIRNLEAARLFIDQLEMLREKTRGNLTSEESEILNHILSDLRFSYVEAAASHSESEGSKGKIPTEEAHQTAATTPETTTPEAGMEESENKKKFSKSYGA